MATRPRSDTPLEDGGYVDEPMEGEAGVAFAAAPKVNAPVLNEDAGRPAAIPFSKFAAPWSPWSPGLNSLLDFFDAGGPDDGDADESAAVFEAGMA